MTSSTHRRTTSIFVVVLTPLHRLTLKASGRGRQAPRGEPLLPIKLTVNVATVMLFCGKRRLDVDDAPRVNRRPSSAAWRTLINLGGVLSTIVRPPSHATIPLHCRRCPSHPTYDYPSPVSDNPSLLPPCLHPPLVCAEFGVYAELPTPGYITFVFGPGSTPEHGQKLMEAIRHVAR